jgi:hypothetical protein
MARRIGRRKKVAIKPNIQFVTVMDSDRVFARIMSMSGAAAVRAIMTQANASISEIEPKP